jgi:ribosomal protein S18 acetylase RimI-like enzyme
VSISVDVVDEVTDGVLDALNRLVPQLSSRAQALDRTSLGVLLASPGVTLFVARRNGEEIGTLTLVVFSIPSGERAWIEDVVVDESARGSGAGEALVRAAIAHAASLGLSEVDLTSRPTRTAANALYQKMGFVQRETNVYRFSIERGFPSESA